MSGIVTTYPSCGFALLCELFNYAASRYFASLYISFIFVWTFSNCSGGRLYQYNKIDFFIEFRFLIRFFSNYKFTSKQREAGY